MNNEVIAAFTTYQNSQRLSPATIRNRASILSTLMKRSGVDLLDQSKRTIRAHLGRAGITAGTARTERNAIVTFFDYCVIDGYLEVNPAARIPAVKAPKGEPRPFTTEQIDAMMNSGAYRKTRAMILLGYYQGFHVSQIARVRGDDIDMLTETIGTVAKGNKDRRVPLHPTIRELSKGMPPDWWFPARDGSNKPVSGASVTDLITRAKHRETRLINQETFMVALGRAAKAKGGTGSTISALPPFLSAKNLRQFITPELELNARPVRYTTPGGGKAYGFKAEILADVCEVYLDAQSEGYLLKSQEQAAAAANMLMRGMARVGITALVDEATGFQVNRERHALQKILEQYVAEQLRPWLKQFPDEFFREVYRIHGWKYNANSSKRPGYIGKFINSYVYDALPEVVVGEIEKRNPKNEKGNRSAKHHQLLTDHTGIPSLDKQITSVVALMRASDNKATFKQLYSRAFPKNDQPVPLFLDIADIP